MNDRRRASVAYFVLLFLSLPVPVLHHFYTDGIIETMRPVFKGADGQWTPMLMPVHVLFLRWLGQLSWWVPAVVLAVFVLSFRRESLARWETVCAVAVAQCAGTAFYACYSTWLLGEQWMEWVRHRV